MAPKDIINYIILHELCHLKIKEHSHHFWELLPDTWQITKKKKIDLI